MTQPEPTRAAIAVALATVAIDAIGVGIIFPVMPDLLLSLGLDDISSGAYAGGWLEATGDVLDSVNPATEEPIGSIVQASLEDYEKVVESAEATSCPGGVVAPPGCLVFDLDFPLPLPLTSQVSSSSPVLGGCTPYEPASITFGPPPFQASAR